TNGYIYIYYAAAGGERRTVLSRLHTTGTGASLKADPASELILLQIPQPFGNHKGGELVFGPDGMLYLGLGDGGSEGDPNGNGQDTKTNLLASIIRIDVRDASKEHPYAIPPDNPFATSPGGTKPETWAYGLRNPWRFSFDAKTGELWAGEVGQNKYEEVDIIEPGKNYGWNIMEGFHCYKPSSGCDQSGLTLPVIEYPHSDGACSITGGYVYRGTAIPALDGAYVYADYCSGRVSAFPTQGAAPGSKPPVTALRDSGTSVTSLAQDNAGELYLLEEDGKIYRMTPS
ncbi:MAG: PQQ-dependent sugar dehydrogenase, partial [Tepidiformaceae bacterium]